MSRNSVTGRFRDIEISFSVDGTHTVMGVRNLTSDERQVRVMYQKLAVSGLANWKQFQLTNAPVSFRLPAEVLEAYRLTFFVDKADPISARVEKILAELEALRAASSVEDSVEDPVSMPDTSLSESRNDDDDHTTQDSEITATQPVEEVVVPRATERVEEVVSGAPETLFPEAALPVAQESKQASKEESLPFPSENRSDDDEDPTLESEVTAAQRTEEVMVPRATEQVKEVVPSVPETRVPEPAVSVTQESEQVSEEESVPVRVTTKIPTVQNIKPLWSNVDTNLEFKITVPSLPASALAEQRELQAIAKGEYTSSNAWGAISRRKEKGIFGQFVRALGLSTGGRRGKAYYREKGEAIQNEFQDQLAKLERDYNEGYGLNLVDWDPKTLCEEETAVLLLNLMVNEVSAWQKEVGRATPETKQFVETLAEINTRLRQTLKQTRGISTPSPTLFPDLLAENQSDLEKIQSECDAYLQRFATKLTEQEKKHAAKIEVLIFKKFLIEFVRDFLFVEVAKSMQGNELPERLTWFLDLVDSEVIPIEVGKTKVSSNHHKIKGAGISEFESGTIVEVVTPGLQSKDGKRVSHMAVVIEAE